MKTVDPTTGRLVREYPDHTASEVERRLSQAARAFDAFRRTSFEERAAPMRRAAELLRAKKDELAELMAKEMGKPLAQGRAEAEKCAVCCEYFAAQAAGFLADEVILTEARTSYISFRPLGAVLAIMPWNYPLWQVIRFAAPALMAGNVGLLKHASNVAGCAFALESLFREAGFGEGAFQTVFVDDEKASALIDDSRVAAVTLTGSTRAGRAVGERAGRALKHAVLELGGSDPYVVLADADVEHAAATCVAARLVNAGQSCIAAKRFIVVPEVRAEFEERFVAGMKKAVVGDPRAPETEVGPLARVDLRDALHRQVSESVSAGARLALGGVVPAGPGAFYAPTVLTRVKPGMPAFDEELFGPVAAIVPATDESDAIRLANATTFGLGAAVFTKDRVRGERLARDELVAGACFVNAQVKSDPRLPFGGVKASGHGRELSAFGIREFVNVKTVFVE
jgi:succinate-semialdehyde dehydrogenase/glutarate-semialdehyde dehydrogenase